MSAYHLVKRTPSVEDYTRVRIAAGLGARDPTAAEVGLANTEHGVCVEGADEGTTKFYEKYGFRVRTPESSSMSFMTR